MTKRFVCAFCLLATVTIGQLYAQGTLYYSNLGATPAGSAGVGTDFWVAQQFFTGADTEGYILNSVELLTAPASGSPAGFSLSIYDRSGPAAPPSSELARLTGSDPSAGGVFTYASFDGLVLSPSTAYFIVVTADTPLNVGAFNWSATRGDDLIVGLQGWTRSPFYHSSPDGLNWQFSREYNFQFAINATAIPEPPAFLLVVLGALVLAAAHVRLRGKT